MAHSPQQKDDIRQKITQTCAAQIAEKGLQGVSGRSLAGVLGKSVGYIYNFHDDFDAIILSANSLTLRDLDVQLSQTAADHAEESVSDRFLALALTYLRFSLDNHHRWAALFEHRMPEGRELSASHKLEHYILFRHIEAPLSEIMPDADDATLRATARTIYSSVHGVVALSLQGRLDRVPLPLLEDQLRRLTSAFARGFAAA
ncbi:TetR/AcrR family transcriptional regulator [Agrobacterium rubi]|nr:TetR/AcrR family transcriptional regulator [Agrobacterium rubi]NTF24018.1 TetR/AcrR family transcriptional regulator [Agrobacterium rubi]